MAHVIPFDAALGAEVRDVDLSRELDEHTFRLIETAWNEYAVLVFRDQHIAAADQVRFTSRFGEPKIHWLTDSLHPEHPEVLLVSNVIEDGRHIGVYNAGRFWHSDLSYVAEPDRGGFLYALEIPSCDGRPLGDTLFASTSAAYDALDEHTKATIAGLSAVFSVEQRNAKLGQTGDAEARPDGAQQAGHREAVHRVVRTHPVTGRKCLYVSEGHTSRLLGLAPEAGERLLASLCAHACREEFVYRHRWQVGDLVMWDNVPTQHKATFDYALPQRRLLHRTTIKGYAPQ